MAFEVRITHGKAGDRSGEVYELIDTEGAVRAEVWPQWGFNCLKWQVRREDAHWADVLFHMPDWESNPVPTRSGHPILFPFPGRLRGGQFTFDGKTYQVPLTDNTKLHAIHGFTPRNRWRVVDASGDEASAAVTGEFNLATDLPDVLACWPSDFVFNVTYRLSANKLRVDARVKNVGAGRLPFGLGYHGYFRLPGMNDPDVGSCVLQAHVAELWETENNLPTGLRTDIPAAIDFRHARPIGTTALDNAFTGVTGSGHGAAPGGMHELARLAHPNTTGRLRVLADAAFRELVLFTPTHRHAVAIEPYTCSADAANFWARGIDCGWRVVDPGAVWEGAVEYHYEPAEL
jgi:aldose 1-epimerase